jgi:hypothetical protein
VRRMKQGQYTFSFSFGTLERHFDQTFNIHVPPQIYDVYPKIVCSPTAVYLKGFGFSAFLGKAIDCWFQNISGEHYLTPGKAISDDILVCSIDEDIIDANREKTLEVDISFSGLSRGSVKTTKIKVGSMLKIVAVDQSLITAAQQDATIGLTVTNSQVL